MRRLILFLLFLPCVAMAQTVIATNNAAILYSPYNWVVTGSSAKTLNAGAYFRTIFSGTSVAVTFDTSSDASPYPELYARVDGDAWQQYSLSAGNPTWTIATGLPSRKHFLEVMVKSLTAAVPRWSGSQTIITVTSLVLDTSANVHVPVRHSKNVIIFGDSITEGAKTQGNTAPLDTDMNDILSAWSYSVINGLDAEVGIVGFGGTGITVSYDGVPNLPYSFGYIIPGSARVFTPVPDLVIYAEGQNDGAASDATFSANFNLVMSGVASVAPNAPQLALIPLTQTKASGVIAAVTLANNPKITYAATSGWINSGDTVEGVHPWAYAGLGLIAPRVLPLLHTLLYPSTTVGGSTGPTGFVY